VDIEGLGSFIPGDPHKFRFVPQDRPRVFIGYVQEDIAYARKLYNQLAAVGFSPWLDKKKLLPGQNWPRSIEMAIQSSDFFVACFSRRSVCKRGAFHSELRFALECASKVPLDEIFFIPVRLDECVLPGRIANDIQYIDLFPDWSEACSRLVKTMVEQSERRKRKQLPLAG
jgi:hypothetical protein